MDRDDGVGAVVLAAEHLLGLGGLDFALELVEPALEISADVLAGVGPLEEDADIVGRGASDSSSATSSSTGAAAARLLRRGLAFQKSGAAARLWICLELAPRPAPVKISSEARAGRRGSRYRRIRSSSAHTSSSGCHRSRRRRNVIRTEHGDSHRGVAPPIADTRSMVAPPDSPRPRPSRLFEDRRLPNERPVGIDDAADAGIGGGARYRPCSIDRIAASASAGMAQMSARTTIVGHRRDDLVRGTNPPAPDPER